MRRIAYMSEMNAYESLNFKGIGFDIFMTMKILIFV